MHSHLAVSAYNIKGSRSAGIASARRIFCSNLAPLTIEAVPRLIKPPLVACSQSSIQYICDECTSRLISRTGEI